MEQLQIEPPVSGFHPEGTRGNPFSRSQLPEQITIACEDDELYAYIGIPSCFSRGEVEKHITNLTRVLSHCKEIEFCSVGSIEDMRLNGVFRLIRGKDTILHPWNLTYSPFSTEKEEAYIIGVRASTFFINHEPYFLNIDLKKESVS